MQIKFDGSCFKQDKVTFTHEKIVNTYIFYEIGLRKYDQGVDFTLSNSLFGPVKLVKNIDPDKYKYSGYDIEFDAKARLLLKNGSGIGKNVIIFGVDMSS